MNKSKVVSFSSMKNGSAEDFKIIADNDQLTAQELPERIIAHLQEMEKDNGAYKISRLEHVLQCATRASRDNADDDWIIAALVHDLGDVLAPYTHGQVAGEIIKPFVRKEVAWVVSNHGIFQMHYNKSLTEEQRKSREVYIHHQYYQSAIDFCENWDQCSFDPDYQSETLEFFTPLIHIVFSRAPFSTSEST